MSDLATRIDRVIEFFDIVSKKHRWLFWILVIPGLTLVVVKELLFNERRQTDGKGEIVGEEKIGECKLVQFSPSKYYLSLSFYGLNADVEEMNGHDLEDLLRFAAKVRGISTSAVNFDSEADAFGAVSSVREPLVVLAELVTELVKNKATREEMLERKRAHNQ